MSKSKTARGPIVIDVNAAFFQADGFKRAAEVLNLEVQRHLPHRVSEVAIPSVVNSAFASELYLKCLYAMENAGKVQGGGHNLHELFNQLSDCYKAVISCRWQEMIRRNPHFSSDPGPRFEKKPSDLIYCLNEGGKAFVAFRYLYEPEALRQDFRLAHLPDVLRIAMFDLGFRPSRPPQFATPFIYARTP